MHLTSDPLWYVLLFVLSESCSSCTGHSSSFVLKGAAAFTVNLPKRLWTISSLVPLSILNFRKHPLRRPERTPP